MTIVRPRTAGSTRTGQQVPGEDEAVATKMEDHPSVLVVDDQQSISMLICRCLESIGCLVTAAFDGEEALRLGMEQDFDLVLIDNWLPGLLGVEVLQAWKEAGRPFPVILVSALSDQDAIVKSLQLGAVDFIRKPFDVQELIARVNVHLRVRQL